VIRWEAPGPYRVGFTTREGGVSGGPYASLNLGSRGDDPAAVDENRRLACAELGLDARRLALNLQRHTAIVTRASPGSSGEVGDALWTDEPELPLLALGADCVPIAIVAASGRPALAVVHAGWRGLAAGVVEAAVAALEAPEAAAMIGPSIGPCCYEVGAEVSARFDPDLTRGGILDLWEAAARALGRAGVTRVERAGLCTHCNPERFFSHRRSGPGRYGTQGVIGALER
jgi:YfiH family protein